MKKSTRNRSESQPHSHSRVRGPMILREVRAAAGNKVALSGGILLGGFIPFSVYWLMHQEAPASVPLCELAGYPVAFAHLLVLGGLAYSAKTVYQWGRAVFADRFKAIGFTLLVGGILTFGHSDCLVFPALGILVLINAIAATSRLAETDVKAVPTRDLRPARGAVRRSERVEVPPVALPEAARQPAALPQPSPSLETLARA